MSTRGWNIAGPAFPDVFPIAAGGDWVRAAPFATQGGNQVFNSFWGSNQNVVAPFYVPAGLGIDRIAIEVVSVAGSAGSVIRLNAYDLNMATKRPGALLAEATVDTTTTGVKEAAFTKFGPANPMRVVFIGAASQGAPVTHPTVGTVGNVGLCASTTSNGAAGGYYQDSVSGACPATFTVTGMYNTTPRILLRLAA